MDEFDEITEMKSAPHAGNTFNKEGKTVTDMKITGLSDLQPDPPAETLKRRFFALMPEIDAALDRGVGWKKILAHLVSIGLEVGPELASNYAAQYRREHGSPRARKRRAEHLGKTASDPSNRSQERRAATEAGADSSGHLVQDNVGKVSPTQPRDFRQLMRKRLKPGKTVE